MESENETFNYTTDVNDELHQPMYKRDAVRTKNRKINKLAKKARRRNSEKRK
jgi:hypothetical protein